MIQINDKLRIVRVDDRNLVVENLRTITSEKLGAHEEWCQCGYYGTLKSALLGCLDKQLLDFVDNDISSVTELCDKIEQCKAEIVKAIGNTKI